MRNVFFILLLLSLSGCDTQQQEANANEAATAASPPLTFGTSYDQLLAKFTEINFDTLAISSPDLQNGDSPFMGTGLDSAMTALFPQEISKFDSSFAVFRFPMDADNTALIARVPGEYESNRIVLLVFNHTRRQLHFKSDIAYNWGDAGDWETINSWLIRTPDNLLHQLTDDTSGSIADDEEPEKAESTESSEYYLLHIKPEITDTLSKDSTSLLQTYGHLLRARQ